MKKRLKAFLVSPRGKTYEHLVETFGATFATTLAFNGWHLLNEGGLGAVEAAAPALATTAAVVALKTVRPQLQAALNSLLKRSVG